MGKSVCRGITLYSCHIPIRPGRVPAQYSTLGFFNGMSTELLQIDYTEEDLGKMWEYSMEQNRKCDGSYSFQNIFVMAEDEWNTQYTDQEIWKEQTDIDYPLTMIVFLQLQEYMTGKDSIQEQCEKFNNVAIRFLSEGKAYTYCSVDKNDFVVCLKCRNYHNAVETIKALHTTGKKIVYSYSVFSISHIVLERIFADHYSYLFEETIESICLKGITNSISGQNRQFKWNEKYWAFCEKLARKLYTEQERKEQVINETGEIESKNRDRTYDILGDNDFRYIARDVNLGRLLSEFRENGLLSYRNEEFSFYLFSSSLVLNTQTPVNSVLDNNQTIRLTFHTKCCDKAEKVLNDIGKMIRKKKIEDEQILSIYYALHQLLQSFKVLEVSPAKKYDFFSMFHPFRMLLDIVKEKLEEGKVECFSENDTMFDFIHKISMTFHSAQRTDIQFFQIQDFNVIVHYSPAKLRAFYAVWILKLAELYKAFKVRRSKRYSFIFSPGMFDITLVRQLFPQGEEKNRLMLVTLPDNMIYRVKWLSVVLSHEAAHIGCERKRESRHWASLEICVRNLLLEIHAFMIYGICTERGLIEPWIIVQILDQNRGLLWELRRRILEKAKEDLSKIVIEKRDDVCRRERSMGYIRIAFDHMREYYDEKIIAEYCCLVKNKCIEMKQNNTGGGIKEITRGFNGLQNDLRFFLRMFIAVQLDKVLKVFYYIEEEAYADLITILTLEQSMEDYLKYCAYAERRDEDIPAQAEPVVIRMALVIATVCKIAEHKWVVGNRLDFAKKWGHDQLETLCYAFPKNSKEALLVAKIFYYSQRVKNKLADISTYVRAYNPDSNGFDKEKYDFLNDQIVWDALCKYLYECAEEYINRVINDNTIFAKQKEMAETYEELHNGSLLDVVQVIENFLSKYAQESILSELNE